MKKTIVFGLAAGIAMLVVTVVLSMLFSAVFPSLQAEYKNSGLFRPWSDPLMSLMYVQPLLTGLIFAWVWSKTKGIVKGDTAGKKAVNFGLSYWFISLPGMVISYGTFPLSIAMVITWSLNGLAQSLAGGWVLSKLDK